MKVALRNREQDRQVLFDRLTGEPHSSLNQQWLGKITASWMSGYSVLPDFLGLEPAQFDHLINTFFPAVSIPVKAPSGIQLDFSRMLEKEDLINLLQAFSRDSSAETDWVIGLIVSACLGSDHLWQDLGVWNRSELSALLSYNFPKLAARNHKDMKWKKFLYKQLCEAEGLYLCRAPSCEVCTDYNHCFGPEE
jgi:nitrogen fixation protein NifQ